MQLHKELGAFKMVLNNNKKTTTTHGAAHFTALLVTDHKQTLQHQRNFSKSFNANGICNKTDEIQLVINSFMAGGTKLAHVT